MGVVIGWDQNGAIGDIEIDVTGRRAFGGLLHWAGHGERHHVERLSALVVHGPQSMQVVLERFVVHVGWVVFNRSHHGRGSDKPGDVVHMAVRIIPNDPFAEPANVVNPEKRFQNVLNSGTGEGRITIGVE